MNAVNIFMLPVKLRANKYFQICAEKNVHAYTLRSYVYTGWSEFRVAETLVINVISMIFLKQYSDRRVYIV